MRRILYRLAMAMFLGLTLLASATVVEFAFGEIVGGAPAAYAQQTIGNIEQKVTDISDLIRRILYVFTGLGVMFTGFKFVQGDQHAWRYAMFVIVGAAIIFGSEQIVTWLRT